MARKRTMLSPHGVGTLDQALMGAIRSKHQFVRLFGLAGRTVILDEIHAYDFYTGTLLERLIQWLALLGSPVIALSATLPVETRQRLLTAYAEGCNWLVQEMPIETYPRMTILTSPKPSVQSFAASPHVTRSLNLEWKDDSEEDAEWETALRTRLEQGGCAAVICSTVGRAQTVFQRLQKYFSEDEIGLFHGRFLFTSREKIEADCIIKFGKPSDPKTKRPFRYVLVATQVVEQSLDLDFDLMISDLAPIDLILQRSGRLHRHAERDAERPEALKTPTLWLIKPKLDGEGQLNFAESGWVYERHMLLRTWLATRYLETIELPAMMDELIESVYDLQEAYGPEVEEIYAEDWRTSLEKYLDDRTTREYKAGEVKLPMARGKKSVHEFTRQGDMDDDNTIAAVTRIGDPSIAVVFVQRTAQGLVLPISQVSIDLNKKPDLPTIRALLEHSTRISKRGLVEELQNKTDLYRPTHWTSALLKHCRYVELDEQGKAQIGKWEFVLEPKLGVVINVKKI